MFVLTVQLNIFSIHCREARLRPWGPIRLRATTQNSSTCTRPLSPEFPLRCNETVVFRQIISHAKDLSAVDRDIRTETIQFQLVQGSGNVILAVTSSTLARILFPRHRKSSITSLILTPTNKLQSIIGPRVDLITSFILEYKSDQSSVSYDNYCSCDRQNVCNDWKNCSLQFDPCECDENESCSICISYYRQFNKCNSFERFKD